MSAWRASVRLWIVASITWVAYWSLNYAIHCRRFSTRLWCPSFDPDFIAPTTYFQMVRFILGPPLITMALAMIGLWFVKASQRYMGDKN